MAIEDDELLSDLLVRRLNDKYDVVLAGSGEQALSMVEEDPKPELILLDLLLPGMSGFDVLKQLKGNQSTTDIPVIILSNLGEKDDVEKGKELGASRFLVKATSALDMVAQVVDNELEGKTQ